MQPDNMSQLSAQNTDTIASVLGLPAALGLNQTDSSHGPTATNMS